MGLLSSERSVSYVGGRVQMSSALGRKREPVQSGGGTPPKEGSGAAPGTASPPKEGSGPGKMVFLEGPCSPSRVPEVPRPSPPQLGRRKACVR